MKYLSKNQPKYSFLLCKDLAMGSLWSILLFHPQELCPLTDKIFIPFSLIYITHSNVVTLMLPIYATSSSYAFFPLVVYPLLFCCTSIQSPSPFPCLFSTLSVLFSWLLTPDYCLPRSASGIPPLPGGCTGVSDCYRYGHSHGPGCLACVDECCRYSSSLQTIRNFLYCCYDVQTSKLVI